KLMELIGQTDNERGEKEFLLIWKRLDYANEKEVKFAERAFFEARKKKARKIREDDYHKKLERAKSQVKLDLSKIYTLERFDQ
ncbi:MAG: hypothetical protein GXO89_11555, partial [Chlorobi bacterium]|nr:hypothetical protein [Chlorobiota bacterium]